MSERERLRRKWEGRGVLEFRHVGARCPACGFTFTKGFSALTYPGGASAMNLKRETLTLCTRCRRPLAVANNPKAETPLRVLDETALMLLTADDRKAMADMTEILDCYTKGWE